MTVTAPTGPDWTMMSAIGWTSMILAIVLGIAIVALIAVLIRFLLHQMRNAPAHEAASTGYPPQRRSASEFRNTRTPPTGASPVPPENPHAPPTPPVGINRQRR